LTRLYPRFHGDHQLLATRAFLGNQPLPADTSTWTRLYILEAVDHLTKSAPGACAIDETAGRSGVTMDTSYLAQQVTTIIGQLHGLFDEIGVPSHERDSREAEV
jgi:hypothetical protein